MQRQEVFTKVANLMAKHFEVDVNTITDNTHLVDDLQADSIKVMELILDMEDEFDIEVSDEAAEEMLTVGKIVDSLVSL
ncbi:MAG: acyl carrier protein [Streptococcaceae bacterium]|jgi:acyl carrier protein|nr:acyl carrier protein [Streptococcaceae bacterium]